MSTFAFRLLVWLFLTVLNESAPGGDIFALLPERHAETVVVFSNGKKQKLCDVDGAVIFGQSADEIGIISVDGIYAENNVVLSLIDKKTGLKKDYTSFKAQVLGGMLGPIEQVVLSSGCAYFLSAKIGGFGLEFNIFSRESSVLQIIPLPKNLANPLMVHVDGEIFIYSSSDAQLLRFNEAARTLSVVIPEVTGSDSPTVWSTFLAFPNLGLFRLTTSGVVQRVTDDRWAKLRKPISSHIGGEIRSAQLLPIGSQQFIAAVATDRSWQSEIRIVDPASFTRREIINLPKGASSESVRVGADGAFYFFNSDDHALESLTVSGDLKKIGTLNSSSIQEIIAARILSIRNP